MPRQSALLPKPNINGRIFDFRFGPEADLPGGLRDVRFAPRKRISPNTEVISAKCQSTFLTQSGHGLARPRDYQAEIGVAASSCSRIT